MAWTTAFVPIKPLDLSSFATEEWKQYTLSFNSGDNEEIVISIKNGGWDQYIDDFVLWQNG